MHNILITGGAGFIGQHLVKKLLSTNEYKITVIDSKINVNNSSKNNSLILPLEIISFYETDIRDSDYICDIIKKKNIDICVHLAAKVSVSDSILNPNETIDVNVNGTISVLEACSQNNVSNFVFASSAAVYGDPIKLPLSEDNPTNPISPYGASKLVGEKLVSLYDISKKIKNGISLRFFNIYGQGQNAEYAGVITKFAERLHNGLPPIIYGDGNNTRDFISVNDAVNAIVLSSEGDKVLSTAINIGTGKPTSINELAKKMIKSCDLDLEPIYSNAKDKDIIHSFAEISKARNLLNFEPFDSLESGLKEIFKINQ